MLNCKRSFKTKANAQKRVLDLTTKLNSKDSEVKELQMKMNKLQKEAKEYKHRNNLLEDEVKRSQEDMWASEQLLKLT